MARKNQKVKILLEDVAYMFLLALLLFAFAYALLGDKLLTTFLLR